MDRKSWVREHQAVPTVASVVGTVVGFFIITNDALSELLGVVLGMVAAAVLAYGLPIAAWFFAPDGRRAMSDEQ